MKKRTITGIIMALILIPLLIFPVMLETFQLVMTFFVILGSYEMIRMFENDKKVRKPIKYTTILLTLLIYFGTAGFWTNNNINLTTDIGEQFMGTIFIITIIIFTVFVFSKSISGKDLTRMFAPIFLVGLGGASIVVLRILGVRFIVYMFLITVTTDVFAYIIGSLFGKNKMAPNISPNKSWEGAIAGTIISTIVAGSFALFYGKIFKGELFNSEGYITLLEGISNVGSLSLIKQAFIIYPITMVASIMGQIGDLVASKFKRTYNIKDFGKIFPGHGGIMDRFDSAFFVSIFLLGLFLTISKFSPMLRMVYYVIN